MYKTAPLELLDKEIDIPACKGYWFEDKHLYLVDPWGLSGIFEYYYRKTECRDYDSAERCWEMGVKYPEK